MSKRSPCCACCGRRFRPDRYNAHSQKYCKKPDCVRERKRRRQRKWHKTRRLEDPDFRSKENARCAAANRRRRAAEREHCATANPGRPIDLSDMMAGLLSQLADSSDPNQLRALACRYADRGRRLAFRAPFSTGGP